MYTGDSLLELIETERSDTMSFGEFVQLFSVYCLFETQDVLRLCFFMFDKKKSGYVKREEIKNFIFLLHEGQIMSNAEVGMASIDLNGDGDGTFDFRQLRVLHRNFPHLMYPAFRMQIIMQRVTLGEAWWNHKKMELWESQKKILDAKRMEKDKKKHKADARKEKLSTVQNMDVSMEFRVRERMGKFRYTFMPWQRVAVLEELENLDAIEAELEGEAQLETKIKAAASGEASPTKTAVAAVAVTAAPT
jgi:hypothetical protein